MITTGCGEMATLLEVVARAAFLGLDADAIRTVFANALTSVLRSTPT